MGVHALCGQRVGYLNTFSGKRSILEALVPTVPWRRVLGVDLWQGVGGPFGRAHMQTVQQRAER